MPFSFTEAPIASRQNRRIVGLCKLADRGERERTGLFRFDGVKLLCEAVRREVPLTAVFVRAGSAGRVTERMAELYGLEPDALGCPAYAVEDSLFDRISEENAPEGVICVAKALDKRHKMYTINGKDFPPVPAGPAVLLESLRDPVNVGAVIRTAAALGVGCLILSRDCADIYHPRTIRAAMGTLFSMTVLRVDDLVAAIVGLRRSGRRVYAAALDADAVRLGTFAFGAEDCVVIGNEGHGLSPAVIDACDRSVYIPMQGDTESLNASVAAALLMWELHRGRREG